MYPDCGGEAASPSSVPSRSRRCVHRPASCGSLCPEFLENRGGNGQNEPQRQARCTQRLAGCTQQLAGCTQQLAGRTQQRSYCTGVVHCVIISTNALTERSCASLVAAKRGRVTGCKPTRCDEASSSLPSSNLNGRLSQGVSLSRGAAAWAISGQRGLVGRKPAGQTRWYRGFLPSLGREESPRTVFLLSSQNRGRPARAVRSGKEEHGSHR